MDEVALVDGRIFLVVKHAPKRFALLTDKTVTRALAKTRRQRIIAAALWILSIVLSAALGVAFNWCI